jgi:DNA-binding CsgD family transcriptional regulator
VSDGKKAGEIIMCSTKQKNIIPKENLLITASRDIEQICSDLYKNTIINFASYKRTYHDGKFFYLGGTNSFNIHSCENGFFTPYRYLQKIKDRYQGSKNFYYFIKESNPILHKEAEKFNITNVFVIVREYQNYFESMSFGSNNNDLVGFCFNYFDIIEKFRQLFLDKAANLIAQADKNTFPLQTAKEIEQGYKNFILSSAQDGTDLTTINFNEQRSVNFIKNNREFEFNNEILKLTDREKECLQYVVLGYSSKRIARKMGNISYRTIEKHIEHIRYKLKCHSKADIMELF